MFNNKPKIRTVSVPVKKPIPAAQSSQKPKPTAKSTSNSPSLASRPADGSRALSAPSSRYSLTPSVKLSSKPSKSPAERSASLSVKPPARKRKAATPSTPQWASSSSESESDDDLLAGRKRQKTSSSIEPQGDFRRCLEPDMKRRIRRDSKTGQDGEGKKVKAEGLGQLIHGAWMTNRQFAKDYKPAFPDSKENLVVEIQYPSSEPPERFETVVPKDRSNYNPLDDMYFTLEEIIHSYLPESLSATLSSDIDGTVRLLKRAVTKGSPSDFRTALDDFNTTTHQNLSNGSIAKVVDNLYAIPLSLTKVILSQVYARTVSPHAHLLKKVKGRETTYGELLPPLVHTIFHQTRLKSNQVFVDLGSGVGNVVLQSALQTGAESWGIEIMDTPAKFAFKQADELRARARLWNLNLGSINLRHGSFLESEDIDKVLQRADVILVNNKVFEQSLNESLLIKFLDLKMGCKIVSLESFGCGKGGGVRNEQNVASLFDEERYESGTGSVSWAGEGVEYFVATKMR